MKKKKLQYDIQQLMEDNKHIKDLFFVVWMEDDWDKERNELTYVSWLASSSSPNMSAVIKALKLTLEELNKNWFSEDELISEDELEAIAHKTVSELLE
jgi:hypothetical protein